MAATPVDLDGCALLLDEDGLHLVQAGEYSEILMGPEGFLTARRASDGKWTALDESGTAQAEEGYDLIRAAGGRLILKKGGLYALADTDFTPLTPWEYSLILPAGEGFFTFRTNLFDDRADILYILNRDGEAWPTSRRLAYGPEEMASGRSKAMSADSGLYGYLNERGEWAVAPAFSACSAFTDGVAAARVKSGIGAIDESGVWLLSPLYSTMTVGENAILCRENETLYLYRRDDEGLIMVLQYEDAHGALCGEFAAVYTEEYAYLYDLYGTVAATFSAETLLLPGLGGQVIAADENGMYVYDVASRRVFGFYDDLRPMPDAGAYRAAWLGDTPAGYTFGALGADGSEILPIRYSCVAATGENLLAAKDEGAAYVFKTGEGTAELLHEIPLPE